jgi:YbgC/YbaW family acyl-CoA thioester hydrolase
MEIARVRLLEAADLPPQDLIKRGIAPVLTRTEIQYKKMLLLGDRARVDLHIAQLKGFSAKLDFSFWRLEDNELVAQGRQEAIFISLETQKPHKLTPEERQAFEQFM